jgi:undecaprenyl-diphosphatase
MAAMAFYGFLVYLCLQLKMNHVIRLVLIGILIFTILSIGISRIYLGVHYPSDVAAGFAGGFIWVTLCVTVFNVFELSRKRKN